MRLRRLFAMRVRTSLAAKTSFLAPVAFKSALFTTGPLSPASVIRPRNSRLNGAPIKNPMGVAMGPQLSQRALLPARDYASSRSSGSRPWF
jgi:hypothetical protein